MIYLRRKMETIYKAHINGQTKEIQTVKEHSENTAGLCAGKADIGGCLVE